jgi:acyl-CoA thioesterase FadM
MEYRLVKTENGNEILLADGKTVMVAFDYEANQSIPIPDMWKQVVMNYEEGIS